MPVLAAVSSSMATPVALRAHFWVVVVSLVWSAIDPLMKMLTGASRLAFRTSGHADVGDRKNRPNEKANPVMPLLEGNK